jgi:hypothetical protein
MLLLELLTLRKRLLLEMMRTKSPLMERKTAGK